MHLPPPRTDDLAVLGTVFLKMAPFLRTRLHGSAQALMPMFRELIGKEVDALVLFTKGTPGSKPRGQINPRQSFRWNSSELVIEPFDRFSQIAVELGISGDGAKTIESIYAALSQCPGRYSPLADLSLDSNVHVFLSSAKPGRHTRVFFEVAQPYLEMFRTSTIHALNDLYRARDDDLVDIVEAMTPSTGGTVLALLDYLRSHPRFGNPEVTAWEFEFGAWHQRSQANQCSVVDAVNRFLDQDTNRKLLGAGKALAAEVDSFHAMVIPFSRLREEMMIQSSALGTMTGSLKRVARSRSLRSGDWAIVLLYRQPPHANVVHALVQYRQFYFDTYRPQLLKHVRQTIHERASKAQAQYALGGAVEKLPDLWTALRELCNEVLPTIYQALEVSGGVSLYQASDHALETIFTHDEPGARRRTDVNGHRLSLKKGQRGFAATVFLDPDRRALYCRDVETLVERPGKAKASGTCAYLRLRDSTRSEYCCKLLFKATPVGVVNFESARPNGFGEAAQREIGLIVASLEHYMREFLAAQDSHWLAITAAAYHNLHELRQQAQIGKWGSEPDRRRLLAAISAFDQTLDIGKGLLAELEEHFHLCIESQLRHVPATIREDMRREASARTNVALVGPGKPRSPFVDRLRLELLKRITTNLVSNFDIAGESGRFDSFTIAPTTRPHHGVLFWQQQEGGFPANWLPRIGFAPLRDDVQDDRSHHGLFLCGAIARSLGGFLWSGNRTDPTVGPQSVIEIVVPLREVEP